MKIFISYNDNDRGYVQKPQKSLHRRGFNAWFDSLIGYGENWKERISKILKRAMLQKQKKEKKTERMLDYAWSIWFGCSYLTAK